MYYIEHSKVFSDTLSKLKGEKIAVIGHIRPDGDCIGSQIALVRALRALGFEAIALNKDPIPKYLKSFVNDTPFTHINLPDYKNYIPITVDCSDLSRTGTEISNLFPQIKLNIDHHISNEFLAENNIVEEKAAATCEILAGIFLDNNIPIDPITAGALYLGIATDTGQFRFSATNAQVFSLCAKLIELGANPSNTANELYDRESLARLSLLKAFLNTLKLELNGKLCCGKITEMMFVSTQTNREDLERFVDYPKSIDGVIVAALLEERSDGTIKGSLRAKSEKIRVDLLAKHFNGGGHACAAGFSTQSNMDQFYSKFVQITEKHLRNLGVI